MLAALQAQKHELKSQIVNSYKLTAKKEHTRILQRKHIIEERKEQLEHLNDQRVRILSNIYRSENMKLYYMVFRELLRNDSEL